MIQRDSQTQKLLRRIEAKKTEAPPSEQKMKAARKAFERARRDLEILRQYRQLRNAEVVSLTAALKHRLNMLAESKLRTKVVQVRYRMGLIGEDQKESPDESLSA